MKRFHIFSSHRRKFTESPTVQVLIKCPFIISPAFFVLLGVLFQVHGEEFPNRVFRFQRALFLAGVLPARDSRIHLLSPSPRLLYGPLGELSNCHPLRTARNPANDLRGAERPFWRVKTTLESLTLYECCMKGKRGLHSPCWSGPARCSPTSNRLLRRMASIRAICRSVGKSASIKESKRIKHAKRRTRSTASTQAICPSDGNQQRCQEADQERDLAVSVLALAASLGLLGMERQGA